jgi:hypothetical protein
MLLIVIAIKPTLRPGHYFQIFPPIHSRYDSLDWGSARRKVATYTGQHKHRINADIMPRVENRIDGLTCIIPFSSIIILSSKP